MGGFSAYSWLAYAIREWEIIRGWTRTYKCGVDVNKRVGEAVTIH